MGEQRVVVIDDGSSQGIRVVAGGVAADLGGRSVVGDDLPVAERVPVRRGVTQLRLMLVEDPVEITREELAIPEHDVHMAAGGRVDPLVVVAEIVEGVIEARGATELVDDTKALARVHLAGDHHAHVEVAGWGVRAGRGFRQIRHRRATQAHGVDLGERHELGGEGVQQVGVGVIRHGCFLRLRVCGLLPPAPVAQPRVVRSPGRPRTARGTSGAGRS